MRIEDCRLYAILDTTYLDGRDPAQVAAAMVAGGVDIVQLRTKHASAGECLAMAQSVLPVTRAAGVPLIINDRVEVAAAVGAEGAHVGQGDLPVAQARARLGASRWVGKSTHSLDQALAAEKEGANYIGVGPIYATPTKPEAAPVGLELVRSIAARVHIPFFCIGGIKLENAREVVAAGGRRIVVVSGILQAPDMAAYCRELKRLLVDG